MCGSLGQRSQSKMCSEMQWQVKWKRQIGQTRVQSLVLGCLQGQLDKRGLYPIGSRETSEVFCV